MKVIAAGDYVPVWDAPHGEEIIAIVELKRCGVVPDRQIDAVGGGPVCPPMGANIGAPLQSKFQSHRKHETDCRQGPGP